MPDDSLINMDDETHEDHDPGPYFDDLVVGQTLQPAPAITIGPGEAAIYQAICGDPLATSLSHPLAEAVTGQPGALVNPALVLHVSIGQSTVATRRVIANLFYRGVVLHQPVRHGETLHTTVEVRGLSELRRRDDRPARGLALLSIHTVRVDDGATVLQACETMARRRIGALIVFEREVGLRNHTDRGTTLNAEVSEPLLLSIFAPTSPLHDGAVVLSPKGVLAAARCILPVSMNTRLGEDLGTRHRAAVGVTEESDAVVLVVSEERREISLCCRGSILRNQGRQLRPLILDLLSGKLTELPGSEKLVNGDDSVSPVLPEDAETAHATQANPATS